MNEQMRRVPLIDGIDKVTGRARYTADLEKPDQALVGRILRSPVSHADIVRIDATKARALDGVGPGATDDLVRGATELATLAGILGLREPDLVDPTGDLDPARRARLTSLIEERAEARRNRDWKRADEIRAEIDAMGLRIEDTPAGPRLTPKGR